MTIARAIWVALGSSTSACIVSFDDYPVGDPMLDAGVAGVSGTSDAAAGSSGRTASGGSAGTAGAGGAAGSGTGACGKYGEPCCAPATCSEGLCLDDKCAMFAGAYATNLDPLCGAQSCATGNPLNGGTCSCPSSFSALTLFAANDCASAPPAHPTSITLCHAALPAGVEADFAGAFQTDDSASPCAQQCVVQNPYTGACSCPAGATSQATKTKAFLPCAPSKEIDTTITMCVQESAPFVSYAGTHQTDDNGGQGCFVANSITGGCACLGGTAPIPIRGVRYINETVPFIGGTITVCTRS